MTVGLTLGKFLPFHQGHELLLQTAASSCDRLIVLVGVSEDDPYTFEQRRRWIRKAVESFLPENTLGAGCRVSIVGQIELDKNAEKDKDGTITDESYWNKWISDTRYLCSLVNVSKIDRIFTSDLYGERVAKELGATWVPVDPKRNIIPISGTKVRESLFDNFCFLPPYVKTDLTKVVAIVGPESTGKSTLTKNLAASMECVYVPEYGRTLCEHRKELSEEDFFLIASVQNTMITNAKSRAGTPLVLTDTEGLTTALYHETYLPEENHSYYFRVAERQKIDLYVLLAPNVPWIQDGQRVQTDMQRWMYYYSLSTKLREWKKPFVMIDDSRFHIRRALALNAINTFLSTGKT